MYTALGPLEEGQNKNILKLTERIQKVLLIMWFGSKYKTVQFYPQYFIQFF